MVLYSCPCGEKSAGHQRCKAVVTRNLINFKKDGTWQRKCNALASLCVSFWVVIRTSRETWREAYTVLKSCLDSSAAIWQNEEGGNERQDCFYSATSRAYGGFLRCRASMGLYSNCRRHNMDIHCCQWRCIGPFRCRLDFDSCNP